MATVNIYEAKATLSALLAQAEAGMTTTIARAGTPIADLVPHRPSATPEQVARRFGGLVGRIDVPDDIDNPFAADIEAMFGGTL